MTPRWLRTERRRRKEHERYPMRYALGIQEANRKVLEDEMAMWARPQIWTQGGRA